MAPFLLIKMTLAQTSELDKGRRLYFSNCISCHNKDPNLKGSMGPELVDAPLEVLRHKVLNGVYPPVLPPGFKPKRKTRLMRKIPKLEKDIPAIHAWIQSVSKKGSTPNKSPTK